MRRRLLAGLSALLLTAATVAQASAPIYTEEVTDFGRNRWRSHYTPTEPEFPLSRNAQAVWEAPLGLSRSQPLVVVRDFSGDGNPETRIYHIAGDQLWALNGDLIPEPRSPSQSAEAYRGQLRREGFILWSTPIADLCTPGSGLLAFDDRLAQGCAALTPRRETRPFSSSQAAYWKGPTPDRDVIYVGFGHPASLVAVNARTGQMLGGFVVEAGSDRGIVGAPLVFADDTVVIGTTGDLTGSGAKPGAAYIIKGLASGIASHRVLEIGGRISFSPVPVGETGFIMATDARYDRDLGSHGYIMAYNLKTAGTREFSPRWPAAVVTPAGIPGEAAIDAQTVYFADKFGKLYALKLETGELLWCRQYPGLEPCQPGGDPAPAFINSGPGVDEDRVYFAFRNSQGPNTGSGAVVALNKATGVPVWQRKLDHQGNTAPVPMGHVVIVGDTGGYVQAFDKFSGAPVTYGGYPLLLSDEPYQGGTQGERWWEPIGGTATQMTVSAQMMLVGVNSRSDERTVLKAFRLHRLPDLTLEWLDVPATAETAGFPASVRAVCRRCSETIRTTVSLRVAGRELLRQPVTFSEAGGWAATLAWKTGLMPAGATIDVVATVDPDDVVDEADETNNSLRATVVITTSASGHQNDDGWGSNLTR